MEITGYTLGKEIGHGGMATIYLAEQVSLGRKVAIKVMAPALAADRNFGERFLKEARTVAGLTHPNILAVYDVGAAGHSYYLAMEYVPGGDLKQRMSSVGLEPREALGILKQVGAALGYAHEEGFVHRDVKPENVLFRKDGTAVLSDFGIAKAVGSGTKMTGTGMSIGTPHYMSPEQAQGKADIDGRSDFYALGIILYEMLTGHVPFDADNTVGIAMQHVQAPLPQLPQTLSKLQPLLDRLLAKEPEQRYQSAGELIVAIEQELSGPGLPKTSTHKTVVAPKTEVIRAAPTSSNKNGYGVRWAIGGALLAVVLIVGGVVANRGSTGSSSMPSLASGSAMTTPAVKPAPVVVAQSTKDQAAQRVKTEEDARQQFMSRFFPADPTTRISNYKKGTSISVGDLLAGAEQDLDAKRLMKPEGNNAMEKYRTVLAFHPTNQRALAGIKRVAERYVDLARRQLDIGKVDKVSDYLDMAETIDREVIGVDTMRRELEGLMTSSFTRMGIIVVANASPVLKAQYGSGVVVSRIFSGSPAATANLQVGDVILEVNKKVVDTVMSFDELISKMASGEKPLILVGRKLRVHYTTLKLR